MLRSLLLRLGLRRRASHSPAPQPAEVDLAWFGAIDSLIAREVRRSASENCRLLEPLFAHAHRGVAASVDVERGSLLLEFPNGDLWRFAVADVDAAEQIAAAARLGGLLLRLSSREEGLVRIHGVWDRFSYVVHGIPVRDAFTG